MSLPITEIASIKEKVIQLAKKVGDNIEAELKNFTKESIEYKGINDMVSYVDKEAEKEIVKELKILLPGAGFIAEEGTGKEAVDGYNWVIDPLDGTTNFVHGIPIFSVSIALMHKKEILLGVVYDPNRKECFHASKNGGAYLNSTKIQTSKEQKIKNSLIVTGFPYATLENIQPYLKCLEEIMRKTHGIRRLGSAALDLAYVASGRFEAFYETHLNPWDVAAGALIVQEADGMVSDFKCESNYIFGKEIVASCSENVHEAILKIIHDSFLPSK